MRILGIKFIFRLGGAFLFTLTPPARADLHEELEIVGRAVARLRVKHPADLARAAFEARERAARSYAIENAIPAARTLVDLVEVDPLHAQLAKESFRQVALYNGREDSGADQPNFLALNELHARFASRFGARLRDVKFALALRYPTQVQKMIAAYQSPIPHVTFAVDSPLFTAVEWDVLVDKTQPQIPGSRIDHELYPVVARRALMTIRNHDFVHAACGHQFGE